MEEIREFIIEAAGFSYTIESHRWEDDQLVFTALVTKEGEAHRLEVTIREAPAS